MSSSSGPHPLSPPSSLRSPGLQYPSSSQPIADSLVAPHTSEYGAQPPSHPQHLQSSQYEHPPHPHFPSRNSYELSDSSRLAQSANASARSDIPKHNNLSPTHLPTLSSSPLPPVPRYIPPPQHQMRPDPIHSVPTLYSAGFDRGTDAGGQWGWQPTPQYTLNPHQSHLSIPPYPPYPQHRHLSNGAGFDGGSDVAPPSRSSLSIPAGIHTSVQEAIGPVEGFGGYRERKGRGREEDGEKDEIITTIFVVGFPEDMTEREFQGIFTFASGFEAATLKFPTGSRSREPTAALLAELAHLAALRESSRSREISEEQEHQLAQQQQALEEALAALQMGHGLSGNTEGTSTASTSTTPSGATSLTPAIQSGPTLGGGPAGFGTHPPRRQTIGFARFKTRADALSARDQLQGRKIDHLTGATLKAEMAKKNLHAKRATNGEELVGSLLRSGRLASLVGGGPSGALDYSRGRDGSRNRDARDRRESASADRARPDLPSAREAWDSWSVTANEPLPPSTHASVQSPSYGIGPHDPRALSHGQSPLSPPNRHHPTMPLPSPHSAPNFVHPFTLPFNPYAPEDAHSYQNDITPHDRTMYPPHPRPSPSHISAAASIPASLHQRLSISSSASGYNGNGPTDSKALLALAEEADELELDMEWMALNGSRDHTPRRAAGYSGYRNSGEEQQVFGMGTGRSIGNQRREMGMGPTSPTGTSEALSDGGRSMGNPADQNPPINTLYIGNLPAVSPPTHPPNFLEESLRNLFSGIGGYKRMSFRQKINGPMCFVEFEDVGYATMAMQEVYGHSLNGLVKGGIRLSYSKNSLGQRGQSHHPIITPINNGTSYTPLSSPPGIAESNSESTPSFSSLGLSQFPHRDSTTLSPTAQPFKVPSSSSGSSSTQATSPPSRYFSSPPSGPSEPQSPGFGPLPIDPSHTAATPIPTSNGVGSKGPASPVRSSAGLSPASFSWVSTGSAGNGYGGNGEGFPSSLGGVASTWGSRTMGSG